MPMWSDPITAWPTAAEYFKRIRQAPHPNSAGGRPADMEGTGEQQEVSGYRALFRNQLKTCQILATFAG